jgi:hypothetical protein
MGAMAATHTRRVGVSNSPNDWGSIERPPFWLAIGRSLYAIQLINFFKNVCMAGGLIIIIATTSQPVLLPRPARADSNPFA